MKNVDFTVGKMVRPLPHFGAAPEALPEEEVQKAFIQKTMGNAKEFEKGITGTQNNTNLMGNELFTQGGIETEIKLQKGHRRSFWGRRIMNALLLGGILAGGQTGLHYYNQTEVNESGAVVSKNPGAVGIVIVSGVVGSMALLFFNTCPEWSTKKDFKNVAVIADNLKDQINRINQLKSRFIAVEATPDDFISKRIDTLLCEKIAWAAGKLSNRLLKVYDAENSPVRPHFDRIFGGRDKMPSSEDIENLFKYYAVQSIKADHRLDHITLDENSPLVGTPKVSREAFLTKTYALMKAAMNTGDIYNFVMKDENDPLYEQTYNMEMAGMMSAVEAQVQQEFSGIRELATRETELRQYIHKATTRLVPLKLAEEEPDKSDNPDIKELEGLIARLKEKQTRILAMVGEESPMIALPAEDIARLKAEVLSTLQETKAFLAELDHSVPGHAQNVSTTALSELKDELTPALQQAQAKTS